MNSFDKNNPSNLFENKNCNGSFNSFGNNSNVPSYQKI